MTDRYLHAPAPGERESATDYYNYTQHNNTHSFIDGNGTGTPALSRTYYVRSLRGCAPPFCPHDPTQLTPFPTGGCLELK
jgi:hypothetical protein